MLQVRGVFADNALDLHHHGLAVLPIGRDRTPCLAGFQNWSRPPSRASLEKWLEQFGDSNIAILPSLSNVIVADSDDLTQDAVVEELLGETPLTVRTRRGRHRYYRKPPVPLPGDLRAVGLNVDLKAGRSLVIAPPSIHESGVRYSLENCDWSAVKRLPAMNLDKLKPLLARAFKERARGDRLGMRDNSRGQWLNDALCKHAPYCDTLSELLDKARDLNLQLTDIGEEQLEDSEIVQRTSKVWKDAQAGKLKPMSKLRGVMKAHVDEHELLCRLDLRGASDGLVLLLRLRFWHQARCRRGETFCITPRAMQESDVIRGWTRERYEKARDLLLQARLILKVEAYRHTPSGRTPAKYLLATC